MTNRLAGKVALITGGASGLGANAAALMAREGARVVVADIAVERGKAVADKLGPAGHFVKLDVTSEDNWKAAIAETVDKHGALHVLLNSAGIGLGKTVEDITLEEWRRVHAILGEGIVVTAAARDGDHACDSTTCDGRRSDQSPPARLFDCPPRVAAGTMTHLPAPFAPHGGPHALVRVSRPARAARPPGSRAVAYRQPPRASAHPPRRAPT